MTYAEKIETERSRRRGRLKVVGVGLDKTGTNSLHEAMEILGYDSIHLPRSIEEAKKYEFASDVTVAANYKRLDAEIPNLKFICTVRDMDSWVDSFCFEWYRNGYLRNSGGVSHAIAMESIYGKMPDWCDKGRFVYAHERHVSGVRNYFSNRKNLLMFDVKDGWGPLCGFLGKSIPNMDFPHTFTREQKSERDW